MGKKVLKRVEASSGREKRREGVTGTAFARRKAREQPLVGEEWTAARVMERISWSEAHARVYELRPPINLPWFVVAHATFHGFQGLEKRTLGGEAKENDQIEREWTMTGSLVWQVRIFAIFDFLSRILSFFTLCLFNSFQGQARRNSHHDLVTFSNVSFPCEFAGARTMRWPCAYKKKTNLLESSRSGLPLYRSYNSILFC